MKKIIIVSALVALLFANDKEDTLNISKGLCNEYAQVKHCKVVGTMYLAGYSSGKQDLDLSLEYYKKACDLEDGESCGMAAAISCSYKKQPLEAEELASIGCDFGHEKSCKLLTDIPKKCK